MSFIVQLFIGIAIAAVGVFFVLRTRDVLDFLGPIDWAEQHLGGSTMFYKLLGIVVSLIGFIVATDLWDAFLNATIGQLFSVR
jgi:hypothetical protein